MTADYKFWAFPKIAETIAQEKHGERWRLFADDYLGALAHDFWLNRFPRVFHHYGFGKPDLITREVVWRCLGPGKPPAFADTPPDNFPIWEALARVPSEDYGPGCSPPGLRNTFLAQLFLPEAEVRDWISSKGKAKRSPGRPVQWDWDGAVAYLRTVANSRDGLPKVQADVERLVAEWFIDIQDDHPVESAIRKRVGAWRKEGLGRPQNN